ncbi:MAG: glycosyltransferase family 2 protein [Anaerolineales bacterium]
MAARHIKLKKTIQLSVVLPTFNEEDSIAGLLGETLAALDASKLNYELLVVDDGSTDGTPASIHKVAKNHRRLHLIQHPYNKGNGSAIKTGIRAARGASIACMDADGQHAPADLLKLYAYAADYDLVVGARKGTYRGARVRNWGNSLFNRLASWLTRFPIEDLTSGLRLFSAQAIRRYVELLPARFSYPTTTTLVFLKAGYDIKYVPIEVRPRQRGRSKIRVVQDGWRFLVIILKIIVLFEPLQIFLPIALFFFMLASGSTLYSSLTLERLFIPNSGVLLFSLSVVVFLLGMIAEQVTNLQLLASDRDE